MHPLNLGMTGPKGKMIGDALFTSPDKISLYNPFPNASPSFNVSYKPPYFLSSPQGSYYIPTASVTSP